MKGHALWLVRVAMSMRHLCRAAVEDRIARWTMVPVNNGEGIQVLRYEPTEK